MENKDRLQINVEEIMREIRERIRMEEDIASLPAFEDIPIRLDEERSKEEHETTPLMGNQGVELPAAKRRERFADTSSVSIPRVNWSEMQESLRYINTSYTIQYYWNFTGGRIKVFLKRIVRKLAKCLLLPIVVQQTELNAHLVRCINNLEKAVSELRVSLDTERDRGESLEDQLEEARELIRTQKEQGEAQREELLAQLMAQKEQGEAQREELLAQNEVMQQTLWQRIEDQTSQLRSEREEDIRTVKREQAESVDEMNRGLGELRQKQEYLDAQGQNLLQHIESQTNQLRGEREEDIRTVRREQAEYSSELNRRLDAIKHKTELLDRQSDDFSSTVAKALLAARKEGGYSSPSRSEIASDTKESSNDDDLYSVLDYFKFQNEFRGTRSTIRERQEMYLPYFRQSKAPVLDIGCGRGEFLQLMKQYDIKAFGIDLYPEYVVEGELNEVSIHQGDGIAYLQNTDESFGGIFVGQVIEHISFSELETLCRNAYDKLLGGSYLVLESPNPMCLSTFATSFYMDPTHSRPVHPMTLSYLLREIGFSDVRIVFTDSSKQEPLPLIQSDAIQNLEQVNKGIERVSDLLYGSLDYAVIAKK